MVIPVYYLVWLSILLWLGCFSGCALSKQCWDEWTETVPGFRRLFFRGTWESANTWCRQIDEELPRYNLSVDTPFWDEIIEQQKQNTKAPVIEIWTKQRCTYLSIPTDTERTFVTNCSKEIYVLCVKPSVNLPWSPPLSEEE